MRILTIILLLIGGLGAAIIVIQYVGGELIALEGSGIAKIYETPAWSRILALSILVMVIALTVWRGGMLALVFALLTVVVMSMSSHQIVEDGGRGADTDKWAMMALNRLSFSVADGPLPKYTFTRTSLKIETQDDSMVTFRGIWPFQIQQPDG